MAEFSASLKVKALDWTVRADGSKYALDPFDGVYHLSPDGTHWRHDMHGGAWISGGIGAANAHFAERIHSALE
jgi:hypothetical protein